MPGIVPDRPYQVPLGEGHLWVRAGFALEPHHHAAGQHPLAPPQGHDSIYAIPESGAFALSDGASGETADGMDPARAGRLAAHFLVGKFCRIPPRLDDKGLEQWADEQMNTASTLIDHHGGGRATAIAVGPTINAAGKPVLLLASRGDSRAAASHEDIIPHVSHKYWAQYKDIQAAAHQAEQRAHDGFGQYEITVDKGFSSWVGTPHKNATQQTQVVLLELTPGERERMCIVTDGIAGSDNPNGEASFLPPNVVRKAMESGTPQQSISYLLNASTKHDDKAGYTIDWGYAPQAQA